MTKQQIQQAYDIGNRYRDKVFPADYDQDQKYKDFIQIGMQMSLNSEVFYNRDGTIMRIEEELD